LIRKQFEEEIYKNKICDFEGIKKVKFYTKMRSGFELESKA
jgi:hypothetical protein